MKQSFKFVCLFLAMCGVAALSSCDPDPQPTVYTITVADDGNGTAEATIGGTAITEAEEGIAVTLTATPDDGYIFDKWTAESGGVTFRDASAASTTFTMPAANVAIKAEFKLQVNPGEKYSIVLTDDGNGSAAATIDAVPVTEAEEGATVTLTATPGEGYIFDKWSTETDGVTFSDAATSPATFTMPAVSVEIKAEFKPVEDPNTKYTITLTCDGEGTAAATVDGSPVTEAEAGATVTLTATPAEGWLFFKWVAETGGVTLGDASAGSTTFTMPAADVEIKAELIEDIDVLTKIPDTNFNNHCKQYDTDNDGKLSIAEALEVTTMNVQFRRIASMEGVEYFRNLTNLNCGMQSVSNSPLTSLDLSKNTELIELNCQINSLATLDLSKNTKLTTILTQQNKLTSITIPASDIITTLDVNQNLLTTLDVSKFPNLTTLMCSINRLTSLDLSNNGALQYLFCSDNALGSIDVSNNLELLELYCSRTGLTSVDVSKNEKLMDIGVIGNNLTTINLSNNPEIIWLELMNNKITSLDVSKNEKLTDLQVQDNLLTEIDLSKNPLLRFFYCQNNKITSLDLSQNINLYNLRCYNNRISQVDITIMKPELGIYHAYCGNQTTDGTTPLTLTLTMREDMRSFWDRNLANATEEGYLLNANVVVAE